MGGFCFCFEIFREHYAHEVCQLSRIEDQSSFFRYSIYAETKTSPLAYHAHVY